MNRNVNSSIGSTLSDELPVSYHPGPISHLITSFASLEELGKATLPHFSQLTAQEKRVLALVAEGLSNPEIATLLSISRATVQNHRASIRSKLDIDSEVDYVKLAVAHDLISL